MVRPWVIETIVQRSDETNLQTGQEGYLTWTFLDEPLVESLTQHSRLLGPIRTRSVRIRPRL